MPKKSLLNCSLAGFCILNITQAKAAIMGAKTTIVLSILKMLRTIVVFAPIIAALAWVIFNIQKPAREQFNRDFLGKD